MPAATQDIGAVIAKTSSAPRPKGSSGDADAFTRLVDDTKPAAEKPAAEKTAAEKPERAAAKPAPDRKPAARAVAKKAGGDDEADTVQAAEAALEGSDPVAEAATSDADHKDDPDPQTADKQEAAQAVAVVAVTILAQTTQPIEGGETPVAADAEAAPAAVPTPPADGLLADAPTAAAAQAAVAPAAGVQAAAAATRTPASDAPPPATAPAAQQAEAAATSLLPEAVQGTGDAVAAAPTSDAGAKIKVAADPTAEAKAPNAFAAGADVARVAVTAAAPPPPSATTTAATAAAVTLLAVETAEEAATDLLPVTRGEATAAGSTDDALQGFRAAVPHGAFDVNQTQVASPQAAARAAARPIPVMEQIVSPVFRAASQGVSRINIELKPAALGKINVELEISEDKRVVARVIADKPETVELIRREAHQLERALQDAGLQTDSESMTFDLRGNRADERDEARQGRQGRGYTDPLADTDDVTADQVTPLPARRGGGLALIDVSI